jgi:hypothetical protein
MFLDLLFVQRSVQANDLPQVEFYTFLFTTVIDAAINNIYADNKNNG